MDTQKMLENKENLSGADLSDANLRDMDLSDADLRGASLSDANLSGAILRGADLSGANLSGAILRVANLCNANLSGAKLSDATLRDANLSSAKLRNADLRSANLRSANLSGANLSGANLSGADLCNADLSNANLRSAELSGAELSGAINWQLTEWARQCKQQLRYILNFCQPEVPGLIEKINAGKIEGTQYVGECCCLIGSLEQQNEIAVSKILDYKKGLHNHAEQLFMQKSIGDTPENSEFAKMALEICQEFVKSKKVSDQYAQDIQ